MRICSFWSVVKKLTEGAQVLDSEARRARNAIQSRLEKNWKFSEVLHWITFIIGRCIKHAVKL